MSISIYILLRLSVLISSASSTRLDSTTTLYSRWLALRVSFSLSPIGADLFCLRPYVELGLLVPSPDIEARSLIDLDLLRGIRSSPRWSNLSPAFGVG